MKQERPVRDVLHPDPVERLHGARDTGYVGRVLSENSDISNFGTALNADQIDRVEQSACVSDCLRHVGK